MCGESDQNAPTLLFDTSIPLFDYSGSISSKIYYPQEYAGLYSLLGLMKGSKVLEPVAKAKNPAPNTRHYFYGSVDITSGVLNFRYRPNTDSEILSEIPKDTKLCLYPSGTDGWYYTSYMNNWGYVSADFITLDSEITTFTTKATTKTTTRITRPVTTRPPVTTKAATTVTTVTTPVPTTIVITDPPLQNNETTDSVEGTQVDLQNDEATPVTEVPVPPYEPDVQDTELPPVD